MRRQAPSTGTSRQGAVIMGRVVDEKKHILHVGSREIVIQLRNRILSLHGFEVRSTLSVEEAQTLFQQHRFELVLVDVEGQGRVPQAEELCAEIREMQPKQKVAFVCNYQVSIDSDCPDDIIEAEFNLEAFVAGVKRVLD
jgi:DNA-binding NtrC family response regulator